MFSHLQVYSAYSFQQSTISISELVADAKRKNITALALCDHHQMFGMMAFKHACEKNEIKPIYGLEVSASMESTDLTLVLLAKDTAGYFSLVRYSSFLSTQENSVLPIEDILKDKEHLFILLCGEDSIVYRYLLKEMQNEALNQLRHLKDLFGNHLYIALNDHGTALQKQMNQQMIGIAKMLNITLVCSNAVRYLKKEDAMALDLLRATESGNIIDLNYKPVHNQAYLKSEEEMRLLFSDEIINNTNRLALSCQADIPTDQLHLPKYPSKNNASSEEYLKALCIAGLKKRFDGKQVESRYITRLQSELKTIIDMHFADYFLIVYDYVHYAKMNHILVGPGRGSAAGSLVAYVLGITNIDPIKYDLIFERFLNPERVSMPDIDVDFQDDRREEVVDYVIERYGKDHVCQISTFNTYGPKVAIRDLGKTVGLSAVKIEQLNKLIPTSLKQRKSAKEMYETSNAFSSIVQKEPLFRKIMPAVFVVENLPRNVSTHAAGVILSNEKLNEIVPLVLGPTSTLMTQYSKDYIEEVGLLKMDFLGLRNLTILSYILEDVYKLTKQRIDINKIPLDDQKTYEMIAQGDTFGVFQLESDGMVSLLRKMKVDAFEDVIAAIALYRPGPMENIPAYLKRKLKEEPVTYIHEDLKDILKPTYGIMIYQEQIMQIATKMAGFTMGRADILRKAVSKKGSSLMQSMRDEFIGGAIKNGYDEQIAISVFNDIEKFANYGFNRSHSVAYAYVAYQMAYLKAHYPLAFFAALLSNNQSSDHNKLVCMQEARKYKVSILKPSVNYSYDRFIVENNNIRFSLLGIKDFGIASYQALITEREKNGKFEDYQSFVMRMSQYRLTNKTIEALIDAGALDEFNLSRKMMKINLDLINKASIQTLSTALQFDLILEYAKDDRYELLENEKRVLGIYLTTHPVVLTRQKLNKKTVLCQEMSNYISNRVLSVLCIDRIKTIRDKKGQNMCFLTLYDETGSIDAVLFADQYDRYKELLRRGVTVLIEGKVAFKQNLSITIQQMKQLK